MRLAAYSGVSLTLATGVVLKALHQRANFYAACVYLSQSSANLMILTNFLLLIVGYVLFGLQRLLYGPLRPIETEQLYEKAWFAVTETCLAMTIFRGEVGGWFLVMFVCLLIGKVWGWIGEGRVEILEQQPPTNPRLFHTRLALSLILSVAFNSYMLEYSIQTVLRQARPDMMVMFGFEFAILTILSTSTAARYTISLVEIYITRQQKRVKMEERRTELRAAREESLRNHEQSGSNEPLTDLPNENDIDESELDVAGWEEKGRWVFYLDLVTDFFKLIVYLSFFAILFTFYGLPIHILRDVVLTVRSFVRRIADFLRYRNATRDMNERYPDATAEEVANEEVCIICREEMTPWTQPADQGGAAPARPAAAGSDRLRPKKLPCGHVLHFACLRSWLERQQNCPTCRRPVVPTPRVRIYPGEANNDGRGNAGVAGQQPAPGAHPPAGLNAPAGDGQQRARVFNFGPLRIGFGAGRGDLFQNLAQQVQNGVGQGAQGAHPNAPAQPGRHQAGFGFGFGRGAAPAANPAQNNQTNTSNIQLQLSQIELQITQEINNLRVTADQLHMVRLLQAELVRLRSTQASLNGPGVPPNPAVTTVPPYTSQPIISSTIPRPVATNQPAPTTTMGSGDSNLPEGLTLPEGWSLVPLQRVEQFPVYHGQPDRTTQPGPSLIPHPSHTGGLPPPPVSYSYSHTTHATNPGPFTSYGTGTETLASNPVNWGTTHTAHTNPASPPADVPASSSTAHPEPHSETPAGESASTERGSQGTSAGPTVPAEGTTGSATPPLGSSWTEVSSDGLVDKQESQQPVVHDHGEGGAASGGSSSIHANGSAGTAEGGDEKGKAKAVTVEEVADEDAD